MGSPEVECRFAAGSVALLLVQLPAGRWHWEVQVDPNCATQPHRSRGEAVLIAAKALRDLAEAARIVAIAALDEEIIP